MHVQAAESGRGVKNDTRTMYRYYRSTHAHTYIYTHSHHHIYTSDADLPLSRRRAASNKCKASVLAASRKESEARYGGLIPGASTSRTEKSMKYLMGCNA
jgi:hypothetical protein